MLGLYNCTEDLWIQLNTPSVNILAESTHGSEHIGRKHTVSEYIGSKHTGSKYIGSKCTGSKHTAGASELCGCRIWLFQAARRWLQNRPCAVIFKLVRRPHDFGPSKTESRAKVRISAVIQSCSWSELASKTLRAFQEPIIKIRLLFLTSLYTFDKMIKVF